MAVRTTGPEWLYDIVPAPPGFEEGERVASAVEGVRAEVDCHLEAAIRIVGAATGACDLQRTLTSATGMRAWLAALHAHRYGAVYWGSRSSCRSLQGDVQANRSLIDDIGEHLRTAGAGNAIWNVAVAHFVSSPLRRRLISPRWVPPRGFHSLDRNALAVNSGDFDEPESLVGCSDALFDLHDFAHLCACRINPLLYRNFQHDSLSAFPDHIVRLVAGPGYHDPDPVQHADGVVFSHILTPLFSDLSWRDLPEAVVVDGLAERAASYLLGETPAYCTRVDADVVPTRSVNVCELAVLAQNKRYEHPASEIEQLLFVRSGTDGNDAFEEYSASDRLLVFASLSRRTFHEARNTLKHRAHRLAYRVVASRLLRSGTLGAEDRRLACMTLDHLDYVDVMRGEQWNLFDEASALLGTVERPGSLTGLGIVSR